jgi:protein-glucosylgalactosylhydroxylysine glucosidase
MKKALLLICIAVLCPCLLRAQDSTFTLTADRLHPYFPAYLGNGFFSIVSSPLGTKAVESYAAWIFDEGPGDISRIAQLPAWNAIDYSDGTQWLNASTLDSTAIGSFRQIVNMEDGLLHTAYVWSIGTKHTKIETETFISRANKNLAAVRLAVTPDYAGTASVSFSIQTNPQPRRMRLGEQKNVQVKMIDGWPDVWYPGYMGVTASTTGKRSVFVIAKAEGRNASAAECVEFDWSKKDRKSVV